MYNIEVQRAIMETHITSAKKSARSSATSQRAKRDPVVQQIACDLDEHLFIGFDCAYRTLGWCIIGYNPCALTEAARDCARNDCGKPYCDRFKQCVRDLFHLRAGGVEDVLGQNIDEVDPSARAVRLLDTIRRIIPEDIIARSTVIIEKQPRKRGAGFCTSVHDTNQTVEAQLVFYFSAIKPAHKVYLISAGKKNTFACTLLKEEHVKTYNARKKQSRRAYVCMAEHFNFSAHVGAQEFRHVKADRADACIQIIAAIFLCANNI